MMRSQCLGTKEILSRQQRDMCALLQWEGYGVRGKEGGVLWMCRYKYGWGPGGQTERRKGCEKANKR